MDWSEAVGQVRGFQGPVARGVRCAVVALTLAVLIPCAASAKVLGPWGSKLATPASLDTANGSYGHQPTPHQHTIAPTHHDAADVAVWNTRVARGRTTAAQSGQLLAVRIRGCARQDPTAPSQLSAGVPVTTFNIQTLAPRGRGLAGDKIASGFRLPFCSQSTSPDQGKVNTGTITTFHPLHMCINRGETVAFHDIGGYIPPVGTSGPWYPQGVPFIIFTPTGGSSTASFADAQAASVYRPGAHPAGPNGGWGSESHQELLLQVVEGVGADAYGLCPGGHAEEPGNSNAVTCVLGRGPTDGHRRC